MWLLAGYVLVSPLVDTLSSIDRADERVVAFRTLALAVAVSVLGWFF